MLPHLLSRWGSLHFSLETAVLVILERLYEGIPLPTLPKSEKTKPKINRNAILAPDENMTEESNFLLSHSFAQF
jgi:hypothetical protein